MPALLIIIISVALSYFLYSYIKARDDQKELHGKLKKEQLENMSKDPAEGEIKELEEFGIYKCGSCNKNFKGAKARKAHQEEKEH